MEIHIEGSLINGSIVGEGNRIVYGNGDIDWEYLQEEWIELLKKLPVATDEYKRSSEVLNAILNKTKVEWLKY